MSVTVYRRFQLLWLVVNVEQKKLHSACSLPTNWRVRRGVGHLTLGADSPIGNVGFIDVVAMVVRRREAGRGADRAINVDHASALSTDQMVVVVVDAVLVAGCGSHGLNPTHEVVVNENSERVVHCLARDAADISLSHTRYFVGSNVRSARDRPQHRQSLGRHLNAMFAQLINGGDCH